MQNILVSEDLREVKLCDFGVSGMRRSILSTATSPLNATTMLCAPETVTRGDLPTFETDIWAAGCTIVEIYTQRDIWDPSPVTVALNVFMQTLMNVKRVPHGLEELGRKNVEVASKIEKCLAYEPKVRPSAAELFELW